MRTILILALAFPFACSQDWPEDWKKICVGMTYDEVVDILGKPSEIRAGLPVLQESHYSEDGGVWVTWSELEGYTTLTFRRERSDVVWKPKSRGLDSVAYTVHWNSVVIMDRSLGRVVRKEVLPSAVW